MVRSGLVTAWRFAGWPTRRSPSSVKATIEGVVLRPSEFSMTFGVLPSITATQELVVPRSMPMTLPIVLILSFAAGRPSPITAPHPTPKKCTHHRCSRRLGSYRRAPFARKDLTALLSYDLGVSG